MSVQESKRNLKEYFAKSFNDQFAVNQNTQFTLLTTITVSLATVIAGLGYVISTYCTGDKLVIGNNALFYAAANSAASMYGYGVILLVSAMSFSFRRDQMILNNLRNELGMFRDEKRFNSYLAIFPPQYTGQTAFDRFPFYHFNWMPNHYAVITRIVLILLLMINIQFAAFLWNGGIIFHYNATIDFNLIALGIWPPLLFFLAILTPAYYRIWFNEHHLNRKPKGRIERLILSIGKHIP